MKQKLTSNLQAINVLHKEGLVIHATDTVFGVSGKYNSLKAYNLIYTIKKRSEAKPLGILISEFSQIEMFTDISLSLLSNIISLLEKGITILLPRKKDLPAHITIQSEYIGLRIPNHRGTKEIIKATGPLISTSANLSGSNPISSFEEALPLLGDGVYYLERGENKGETPSTILRYEDGYYTLIREGNVCKEEINMHAKLSFNNSLC